MNSLLEYLHAAKIPVGWTTLFVGWLGPDQFLRQVTVKDVADHAISLLLHGERIPQEEIVARLAGAREAETESVRDALWQLADRRPEIIEHETRKWRIALLSQLLQNLPFDPLYGLITLSEFWSYCGYPSDIPLPKDNPRSAIGYFTAENFAKAVRAHHEWITSEQNQLIAESYQEFHQQK